MAEPVTARLTMQRSRVLLLCLPLLAACYDFDPAQPIVLLVGSEWSRQQRQLIENGARVWNLELGSQFELAERSSGAAQEVPIRRSPFLCVYGGGLTSYQGADSVDICELEARSGFGLARVAVHELGHVLGIQRHARSGDAIMYSGPAQSLGGLHDEDRALFYEANPGFVGAGGCQVIRLAGRSVIPPLLLQPRGSGPLAVWAEPTALRLAPIDPPTGEVGAPISIATTGQASQLVPVSGDGSLLAWREPAGLFVASLDPAGPRVRRLQLELAAFGDRILDLSLARLEDNLYVAISQGAVQSAERPGQDRYLELDGVGTYRFALDSGAPLPFALPWQEDALGRVAVLGGALVHATLRESLGPQTSPDLLRLRRLGAEGQVLQQVLEPEPDLSASLKTLLHLHASGDRLFLLREGGIQTILVQTISADHDGRLQVSAATRLETIGWLPEQPSATLAENQGSLFLALSAGRPFNLAGVAELHSAEVQIRQLDPVSLAPRGPWLELSAPDQAESLHPQLHFDGARLLAVWQDGTARSKVPALVRSRCFDPDPR